MKFLFFPSDCTPFHGKTLEERPLGGTETGVIGLGDALASLGHEVYVVSAIPGPKQGLATYLNYRDLAAIGPVDILIAVRNFKNLFLRIPHKKRFFWTGDSHRTVHTYGIGDPRIFCYLHGLLTVSDWQAYQLCKYSGFPKEKAWTLRNGVFLANFEGSEKRKRDRLIYSSVPNRGLQYLLPVFKVLKEKHPGLELHLFCATSRHNFTWPSDNEYDPESNKILSLFDGLKDCHLHPPIKQGELAREFMKSGIWAYPTDFEETSCITAMEAQAAGCAIVTSHLGALPETVRDAGILIKEKPGSAEYLNKFIQKVDQILLDDGLFHTLSGTALERAKGFDWKARARSFLEYLFLYHGM